MQEPLIKNVLVFIIKDHEEYLSSQDLMNLKQVSEFYNVMILDILELRLVDFSSLKNPSLDYAEQQSICPDRVMLATAGLIFYGLHPGMLVRYLKGEYVGESRDPDRVLHNVLSCINAEDVNHIRRILTQG